jgi:hypothetical protein
MVRVKILSVFIFWAVVVCSVISQSLPNVEAYQYKIRQASCAIQIDGVVDECWAEADVMKDFWVTRPIDGIRADVQTEVRLSYDENNIYFIAKCEDINTYVIQSLKRDQWGRDDEIGIVIDGTGQHVSGFAFGVNVANAQTESLIANDDGDLNWDNRWYSATTRHDGYWIAEFAIPLKSLRFNPKSTAWYFNVFRDNQDKNQSYVWAPVPRQFDMVNTNYHGTLVWDQPPSVKGSNIAIIPYVTARIEDNPTSSNQTSATVGGDAKVALTSSLNLDLSVNPDFSQVEVDQQVTNLTRFNIFFPERRQFFLENGDIFSNFGLNDEQLFYTRRIGLDNDARTIPISYGARLTGNLNDKTRIGAFNIQTRSDDIRNGNNYAAFAIQRQFKQRSNVRAIFLNRETTGSIATTEIDRYGRNAGIDYYIANTSGKLEFYGGYLHSIKKEIDNKNGQFYAGVNYQGNNFRAYIEAQHVGQNFYSDMGFNTRLENYDPDTDEIIRIGYTNVGSMINYYHYPKTSKTVNTHWSGIENFVWVNDGTSTINEWYTRVRHFFLFKNTSSLRLRFNHHYVDLLYPFDLGAFRINKGQYYQKEFNTQYNSDSRKKFIANVFAVYGEFYSGDKFTLRTDVTMRFQPWMNITAGIDHNE